MVAPLLYLGLLQPNRSTHQAYPLYPKEILSSFDYGSQICATYQSINMSSYKLRINMSSINIGIQILLTLIKRMKKDNANYSQQINDRITRIRNSDNILGEPDLMTEFKSKVVSTFLGKQKRQETKISYHVIGLNFPTTAHLSSFVNSNLNLNQTKNSVLKVKLCMFDAFKCRDIHVEVSIPGSLELKMYNLQGQPSKASEQDYGRAYFSSVLRSLYPSQFPKIRLYNNAYNYNALKNFILSFIPFSFSNHLSRKQFEQQEQQENLGLKLLLKFLVKTQSYNLGKIAHQQIIKINKQIAVELQIQMLFAKGDNDKVLEKTSQILMQNSQNKIIKQLQLKALVRAKKHEQARTLGQFLLHEGNFSQLVWLTIAQSYFEISKYKPYLKIINTGTSMIDDQEKQIQHRFCTRATFGIENIINKTNRLSDHPELCFKLDHTFLNRQSKIQVFRQALQKADKQKQTLLLIKKLDQSLELDLPFYKSIVAFQKQKGWNKLMQLRGQTFWLESDFRQYEKQIKGRKNYSDSIISNSIKNFSPQSILNESLNNLQVSQFNINQRGGTPQQRNLNQKSQSNRASQNNQSFQGNFSEIQQQDESIAQVPPCSKRIHTRRISYDVSKPETKVLCSMPLEKIFLRLFEDLKLQTHLQKWAQKLALTNHKQNTKQKNQLIAIVFMKKGFLHEKLQRKRKCEQSFKNAMKYSSSLIVNLVSCYSLSRLYLDNKNIKGVQYYTMEVVRLLMEIGITSFDTIPEWAKEILSFVVFIHGKKIINKVTGPLKQLLTLWLCIDNQLVQRQKGVTLKTEDRAQ